MKIILATPLYPPDIGGPSFYAERLGGALTALGHDVVVVNFGAYKHLPSGVRHVAYAWGLYKAADLADTMITFDTFSAGLPAVVAATFSHTPLVVRIGGDFLWEQFVNRTHADIPLVDFYKAPRPLTFKEKIIRWITRMILARSTVVFSSAYQRDIWKVPYRMQDTYVIENAISGAVVPLEPAKKNFVCFSRDIPLKNLARLRAAVVLAQKSDPTISLEDGHVPQAELVERVRSSYAVVVPSLSEITPNFVLDAIRCGKPFIQTKHSAYAEMFKSYGLVIDPLSIEDIAAKLLELSRSETYEKLKAYSKAHPLTRTYDDVARDFIDVIAKVLHDDLHSLDTPVSQTLAVVTSITDVL